MESQPEQTTPPQTPSYFRFLNLPTELRLEVYHHLFASTSPEFADTAGNHTLLPPILMTSRQIQQEATKLFFLRVRRYVNECEARVEAFTASQQAGHLRVDAYDGWFKGYWEAVGAWVRANRMGFAMESRLRRMGWPVLDWLDVPL